MNFDLANSEQGTGSILSDVRFDRDPQFNTHRTILRSPDQLKEPANPIKKDPDAAPGSSLSITRRFGSPEARSKKRLGKSSTSDGNVSPSPKHEHNRSHKNNQ